MGSRFFHVSGPKGTGLLKRTSFLNLVQHRFASHCCETLFLQSVPIVTEELTATERDQATDSTDEGIWVSMENLFLHTLNELGGNLGYLLTNRYASHVLRVLLVVLSGQSGGEFAMRSNLRSKKEKLSQAGLSSNPRNDPGTQARVVPSSFTAALEGLLSEIAAGLDTASLRALAVHPTANPVLQALLELEFSARRNGKAKMAQPLFVKLLPQGWPDLDDADVLFLTNLLYDRIGSHLLETIVRCAPGKTFKWLYRQFLLARIVDAAKHEVATFVAARVVERLGKEDLQHVVELMLPQLRVLVERSRFGIITAMLQRCAVRQVDLAPIHRAFAEMVEGKSPTKLIECMLVWDKGNIQAASSFGEKRLASPGRVDGALLAEAMLELSEPLSSLVTDGLVALSTETLMEMARNHIASRLLQVALMSDFSTAVFRRKYVAKLYEHVAEMAMDPAGSHLVDALWAGTRGMQHCRERIAQELCRKEKELKECHGGRAVWRNWRMNLYKNRRLEWISYSKSSQSLAGDTQRDNPSSAKLKPVLKDTWQRHSADVERRFA